MEFIPGCRGQDGAALGDREWPPANHQPPAGDGTGTLFSAVLRHVFYGHIIIKFRFLIYISDLRVQFPP